MIKQSISFSPGRTAARHDLRLDISKNVDKRLSEYNKHLVYQSPEDAFEELFAGAVEKYNAKQSRPCRHIKSYLSKIVEQKEAAKTKGKKNAANPEYEYVLQIGNRESNPLLYVEDRQAGWGPLVGKSVAIYEQFLKEFKSKNPNFHVTGFDIHVDEPGGTPHAHVRGIFWGEGYKQGMERQCSMNKALENMGYKRGARNDLAISRWRHDQMALLEEIALQHGIERQTMDNKLEHIDNGLYQQRMKEIQPLIDERLDLLNEMDAEIEVLKTWPEYDDCVNAVFARLKEFMEQLRQSAQIGFFKRMLTKPEQGLYKAFETLTDYINSSLSAMRAFERAHEVSEAQQRSQSVKVALDKAVEVAGREMANKEQIEQVPERSGEER